MSTLHDTEWAGSVDERLAELERQIRENTAVTVASAEVVSEVRDILDTAKGAFRFFSWVGRFVSWSLKIGGAVATAYVTVKSLFPNWLPK